jgi:FAS-associated factor 2
MDFNLTPEQEETLLNFQAITENWDTLLAINILSANNWDLDQATTQSFNQFNNFSNLESISTQERRSSGQIIAPTQPRVIYNQPISSSTPRNDGIGSKIKSLFSGVFLSSVPIISKAAQEFQQKLFSQSNEFVPNFGNKILKDMIQEAKNKKKNLLMYIDTDNTPDDYLKTIFCNELAMTIINEYYIGWGVNKDSEEGKISENILSSRRFPSLAAIKVDDPSKPVVIEKIEGIQLEEKVIEFLSRNYVARPIISPKDKILEEDRKIRAKQDRELKEAERKLKQRELDEKKKREEKKREEEIERDRKQKEEAELKKKMFEIGDEPNGEDAAVVSFRLPDGSKIERKFHKDRNVAILYKYLDTQGYKNISILYGFPSVPLTDSSRTLDALGIYPKAVVIVRSLE